jgi:hypothetical protein
MTKDEAIAWAGSNRELAKVLGITEGAVSQWDEVPELQQYRLVQFSYGKLELSPAYKLPFRREVTP